jgi:hypothetical protein
MARTTSAAVILVLSGGDDYGPKEDGTLPDLTPYIETAAVVVDDVIECATRKGKTVSAAKAEIIERWLAAHFYGVSDKPLSSESEGGASGSYHGQTGMYLDATLYGQTAKLLDTTGCLLNQEKRQVAVGFWLGKPKSSQVPYEQRD